MASICRELYRGAIDHWHQDVPLLTTVRCCLHDYSSERALLSLVILHEGLCLAYPSSLMLSTHRYGSQANNGANRTCPPVQTLPVSAHNDC